MFIRIMTGLMVTCCLLTATVVFGAEELPIVKVYKAPG